MQVDNVAHILVRLRITPCGLKWAKGCCKNTSDDHHASEKAAGCRDATVRTSAFCGAFMAQ